MRVRHIVSTVLFTALMALHGAAAAHQQFVTLIPALVGALGTGHMVARALARYGEASVIPVADITKTTASPMDAAAGLRILGTLLKNGSKPEQSISSIGRAAIIEAARGRLRGTQYPTVVAAACELSVATGDSQLRSEVEVLARHPSALAALGVRDPEMIRLVQRRAEAALRAR